MTSRFPPLRSPTCTALASRSRCFSNRSNNDVGSSAKPVGDVVRWKALKVLILNEFSSFLGSGPCAFFTRSIPLNHVQRPTGRPCAGASRPRAGLPSRFLPASGHSAPRNTAISVAASRHREPPLSPSRCSPTFGTSLPPYQQKSKRPPMPCTCAEPTLLQERNKLLTLRSCGRGMMFSSALRS